MAPSGREISCGSTCTRAASKRYGFDADNLHSQLTSNIDDARADGWLENITATQS